MLAHLPTQHVTQSCTSNLNSRELIPNEFTTTRQPPPPAARRHRRPGRFRQDGADAGAVSGAARQVQPWRRHNDIYTAEDAQFLVRHAALPPERIIGVETGGCPHTAIREDARSTSKRWRG